MASKSQQPVKKNTVLKWIEDLDPRKTWLKFELEGGQVTSIYCEICRKYENRLKGLRNFNPSFVRGITGGALKKDNVTKHSKSEMHKVAVNYEVGGSSLHNFFTKTPIGNAFAAGHDETKDKVTKLFDIAYVLAKEEIAFNKFSSFVQLEKRHGVDLGNTYNTDIKCKEFTECIGLELRNDLVEQLAKAEYFSILIDGATDTSATEKESIFVLFVDTEGQISCSFLGLAEVNDGTAIGLKNMLLTFFVELGITNLEKKLIGFMADGASVNLGRLRGLATLLKQDIPWLVSIHCLNHRLELAVKDSFKGTYLEEIVDVMLSLYALYHRSPKKLRQLTELAEIMDETVLRPQKANGTRWVQHKRRACAALIQSYPTIIAHLKNVAEDDSTGVSEKAKVVGLLRKLKQTKFVLNLLCFDSLLQPLAKLSLNLQRESAGLLLAINNVDILLSRVSQSGPDQFSTTDIRNLLQQCSSQDAADVEYRGVKLTGASGGTVNAFQENVLTYQKKIKDSITNRFGDLTEGPVFKCLKILDTTLWPNEAPGLQAFGNDKVEQIVNHFAILLDGRNIMKEDIVEEFNEFKLFRHSNMRHFSTAQTWTVFLRDYKERFPNFWHIIFIMSILPSSNAVVERSFSAMGRVKTDYRSRLGPMITDHLVRITIQGPTLEEFDPAPAVKRFFSMKKRRPNVEPYSQGQEASKKKKPNDNADA